MRIGKDKILHFALSMAITMAVIWLCAPLGTLFAVLTAIGVCALLSVIKEIYDCNKENPTGFDWYDLLADALGMIVGVSILLLFL